MSAPGQGLNLHPLHWKVEVSAWTTREVLNPDLDSQFTQSPLSHPKIKKKNTLDECRYPRPHERCQGLASPAWPACGLAWHL